MDLIHQIEVIFKGPHDEAVCHRIYPLIAQIHRKENCDIMKSSPISVIERLLGYFIDSSFHLLFRRSTGALLLTILNTAPTAVVAIVDAKSKHLSGLGRILMNEAEGLKVISGLVMRVLIRNGLDSTLLWPSEFTDNKLVRSFPIEASQEWPASFQDFVDELVKSHWTSKESPGICFPVQITISNNVMFTGNACTIYTICEKNTLTIITSPSSEQQIQFLDVPLRHISKVGLREVLPKQPIETRTAPVIAEVVIQLTPRIWTYHLNHEAKRANDISMLFPDRKAAEEAASIIENCRYEFHSMALEIASKKVSNSQILNLSQDELIRMPSIDPLESLKEHPAHYQNETTVQIGANSDAQANKTSLPDSESNKEAMVDSKLNTRAIGRKSDRSTISPSQQASQRKKNIAKKSQKPGSRSSYTQNPSSNDPGGTGKIKQRLRGHNKVVRHRSVSAGPPLPSSSSIRKLTSVSTSKKRIVEASIVATRPMTKLQSKLTSKNDALNDPPRDEEGDEGVYNIPLESDEEIDDADHDDHDDHEPSKVVRKKGQAKTTANGKGKGKGKSKGKLISPSSNPKVRQPKSATKKVTSLRKSIKDSETFLEGCQPQRDCHIHEPPNNDVSTSKANILVTFDSNNKSNNKKKLQSLEKKDKATLSYSCSRKEESTKVQNTEGQNDESHDTHFESLSSIEREIDQTATTKNRYSSVNLVDDELARKPRIVDFGQSGPKNQGGSVVKHVALDTLDRHLIDIVTPPPPMKEFVSLPKEKTQGILEKNKFSRVEEEFEPELYIASDGLGIPSPELETKQEKTQAVPTTNKRALEEQNPIKSAAKRLKETSQNDENCINVIDGVERFSITESPESQRDIAATMTRSKQPVSIFRTQLKSGGNLTEKIIEPIPKTPSLVLEEKMKSYPANTSLNNTIPENFEDNEHSEKDSVHLLKRKGNLQTHFISSDGINAESDPIQNLDQSKSVQEPCVSVEPYCNLKESYQDIASTTKTDQKDMRNIKEIGNDNLEKPALLYSTRSNDSMETKIRVIRQSDSMSSASRLNTQGKLAKDKPEREHYLKQSTMRPSIVSGNTINHQDASQLKENTQKLSTKLKTKGQYRFTPTGLMTGMKGGYVDYRRRRQLDDDRTCSRIVAESEELSIAECSSSSSEYSSQTEEYSTENEQNDRMFWEQIHEPHHQFIVDRFNNIIKHLLLRLHTSESSVFSVIESFENSGHAMTKQLAELHMRQYNDTLEDIYHARRELQDRYSKLSARLEQTKSEIKVHPVSVDYPPANRAMFRIQQIEKALGKLETETGVQRS